MIRIIILLIVGLLLANCGEKNGNEDLLEKVLLENCKGKSIELVLPKGWTKTNRHNYEEGFAQSYSYPDSSLVGILCGANAELNYSESYSESKFSRKEIILGRTIIYERVDKSRKNVFDKAFDEMLENSISNK